MADMKLEIVSRKLIRPSKSTPENLQHHNLSLLDELAPPIYVPILYYYLSEEDNGRARHDERCHKLEKALSQILTKFYPLAGRFMEDELFIHCGDQGVECKEAIVNVKLAHFLQQSCSQMHILNKLLPVDVYSARHSSVGPLVAVQVNTFDCGGIVLGVAISHIVSDAFTLATFMNEWAKTSRAGMSEDLRSGFVLLSSLFPGRSSSQPRAPPPTIPLVNVVTKMFWFEETKIMSIKESMVTVDGHFSKVVVVTSMIWKALLEVSLAKHGNLRDSVMLLMMDFRGKSKAAPPTLDIACGNCVVPFKVLFEAKKSNAELYDLMILLRSAVDKERARFEGATAEDILSLYLKAGEELKQGLHSDMDFCLSSSWCRFPLYEADFGWGKPHWVSDACRTLGPGTSVLMDSNSGGIQATITLSEEDMNVFQKNLDISASTSHDFL